MKVSDECGTVIQLTQETEAPQREGIGVGKLPEAEHTGPEEMAVQAPESRPASAEVEVINSEENSQVALVESKKKVSRRKKKFVKDQEEVVVGSLLTYSQLLCLDSPTPDSNYSGHYKHTPNSTHVLINLILKLMCHDYCSVIILY